VGLSMRFVRGAIFFAAFLALVGAAFGGPFEDGQAALDRGDYATALKLLRPLADEGNAAAQHDLGSIYHSRATSQRVRLGILTGSVPPGEGVLRNYTAAVKWYRLSANQGNAMGQNSLGYMYNFGDGVPLNYVEAAKWFRLAADQGDADAQQHLAEMYLRARQETTASRDWLDGAIV
jgi:TPR repeat protein